MRASTNARSGTQLVRIAIYLPRTTQFAIRLNAESHEAEASRAESGRGGVDTYGSAYLTGDLGRAGAQLGQRVLVAQPPCRAKRLRRAALEPARLVARRELSGLDDGDLHGL